jgi:hypothetical protein
MATVVDTRRYQMHIQTDHTGRGRGLGEEEKKTRRRKEKQVRLTGMTINTRFQSSGSGSSPPSSVSTKR